MRVKQSLLIPLMLILSLLPARAAFSYNANLHPLITREAINLLGEGEDNSLANYLRGNLGFENGLNERFRGPDKLEGGGTYFNTRTVQGWIERGSLVEDWPMGLRARTHFYDPVNEIGLTDLPPVIPQHQDHAMSRARDGINFDYSWVDAREYYYRALTSQTKEERDENFARTFRALGQVIHLIEDMAVPAHTRNDNHAPIIGGTDFYERTIRNIPQGATGEAKSFDRLDYYWDSDTGEGLAEYTNYNLISDETISLGRKL